MKYIDKRQIFVNEHNDNHNPPNPTPILPTNIPQVLVLSDPI